MTITKTYISHPVWLWLWLCLSVLLYWNQFYFIWFNSEFVDFCVKFMAVNNIHIQIEMNHAEQRLPFTSPKSSYFWSQKKNNNKCLHINHCYEMETRRKKNERNYRAYRILFSFFFRTISSMVYVYADPFTLSSHHHRRQSEFICTSFHCFWPEFFSPSIYGDGRHRNTCCSFRWIWSEWISLSWFILLSTPLQRYRISYYVNSAGKKKIRWDTFHWPSGRSILSSLVVLSIR